MEFDEFVTSLGFSLAAPPGGVRPMHFQKLVEKIRGTPEERPIAFLMLRTMQKARYDAMNVGHFGLAAPTYTHFTSPIRRYPDLVVHRLLRELRQTRVTRRTARRSSADDLPEIGRHTSDMERRADEAERELVQWKKVRFMADKVGDVFDGYITGVAAFGLFVELVEHYVEGLVHVSTMADDYYRYSEQAHTLFGENTQEAVSSRRQGHGAGGARRPRAAPDRSRPRGRARRRPPTTSGAAARRAARRGRRRSSGRARRKSGARSKQAARPARSSGPDAASGRDEATRSA